MILVTVYSPLTTDGVGRLVAQTIGAIRLVVDCKVNTPFVAGHVRTNEFGAPVPAPARLTVTVGGGSEETKVGVGENTTVLSPGASSLKSMAPT